MVKDHSDNKRKSTTYIIWATLFDQQQGIFYMHHPTERIAHTTAFFTPVVEHWLEREIAPWATSRSLPQRVKISDCVGREREMFYLTTHSTHFIYGYMASDIWLRTILIVRKETRCRHIGYSYRLTARVLLYAPSHRQDNTYHGLCYTSREALAGMRNSSMGPSQEGLIRWPIAPWANALPLSYVPLRNVLELMKVQELVPIGLSNPPPHWTFSQWCQQ